MLLAYFNRKEYLRHRAVSLRQHGFLVLPQLAYTAAAATHCALIWRSDTGFNALYINPHIRRPAHYITVIFSALPRMRWKQNLDKNFRVGLTVIMCACIDRPRCSLAVAAGLCAIH